jgi:hypothetical protein
MLHIKVLHFAGTNQNSKNSHVYPIDAALITRQIQVYEFFKQHPSTDFARTRENNNDSRILMTCEIYTSKRSDMSNDIDFHYKFLSHLPGHFKIIPWEQ